MLVIFGIDGLDPPTVEDFGASTLQQDYHTSLDIPDNIPVHTEVIWPSLITGVGPNEHGLGRTNARQWNNPLLEFLGRAADTVLPRQLIMPIGQLFLQIGFSRQARGGPEYFQQQGVETIFSNTRSKVIGVPGYSPAEETDHLRELGGHSTHEPVVEIDELIEELRGELTQRRDEVLDNLDTPLNVLMVYSYATDMVGHVFWDDEDFLREWYGECEDVIDTIRDAMTEDDSLMILSDHGMDEGEHRPETFFSFSEEPPFEPKSILDVKPIVDSLLQGTKEQHEEVTDQMKGLGYI